MSNVVEKLKGLLFWSLISQQMARVVPYRSQPWRRLLWEERISHGSDARDIDGSTYTSASLYVMYMVEGPSNIVYPFSGMGAIYSMGSRFFRDAKSGSKMKVNKALTLHTKYKLDRNCTS